MVVLGHDYYMTIKERDHNAVKATDIAVSRVALVWVNGC